jgi:hypothetical protein
MQLNPTDNVTVNELLKESWNDNAEQYTPGRSSLVNLLKKYVNEGVLRVVYLKKEGLGVRVEIVPENAATIDHKVAVALLKTGEENSK